MENDDDHLQVLKLLDIKEGKTGAFVDSSGVGKSTLINKVLGKDVIKTSEIRLIKDDYKKRFVYSSKWWCSN